MGERVLTDSEASGVAYQAWFHSRDFDTNLLRAARAVEAAVLARVDATRWGGLTIQKGVTEREARRREREAYTIGHVDARVPGEVCGLYKLDKRYPLPTCDKCGQALK